VAARSADAETLPGERLWLGIVLAVALLFRLLRFERVAVLFNDGPVFLALAERFRAGDVAGALAHPFHPLYPAAIAAAHALLGPLGVSLERSAAIVSALAGTAAVLALWTFARSAFGPRAALVAAALLAVHAGAVETSGDVQSEALYLALFLAALAALWHALDRGRLGAALAAGAFSGLAYLTRPEGLGVAALGAGLAGFGLVTGRWPGRRRVAVAAAAAVAAALVAAPYVGWLSAEEGTLALTRKKSVSWVVGVPGAQGEPGGLATGQPGLEAPRVRQTAEALAAEIARRSAADAAGVTNRATTAPRANDPVFDSLVAPPWTARGAGSALADLLGTARRAFRLEMLLLVAAGVLAARAAGGWRPGPRGGFVAAVVGLYGSLLFGLAMNVGYVSSRHLLPPLAPLLGYAGLGVVAAGERAARGLAPERAAVRRRAVVATLVGAVALLCVGKSLWRMDQRGEVAERIAAEWLRTSQGSGRVVAARKRRVAYYAGAPFVQLRPKRPEGFLRYFADHDVRFVVVNEHDLPEYVGLAPLIGPVLEEVRRVEAEGETALVLGFRPTPAVAAERRERDQ
jgi:4-amino-4-deoxy-L-arabinose transferase-like glycosyltransferase